MNDNVVSLYPSNFRDVAGTLRQIADRVENGDFGEVGAAGVVLLGNTMEVFGLGEDSDAPSTGLLLHAGFMRLSRSLEEHGR